MKNFSAKNLEYYAVGLLALIFIAYWPTYFSKFFDGTAEFSHYFHFHTASALLWVAFLIAQPILVRQRKMDLHRSIGKFSYLLVPILFISVMLLAHSRIHLDAEDIGRRLWIPFKDLIIFSFGFGVAIYFRKKSQIHARGMVVAGMALIEPTMVRFFLNVLDIERPLGPLLGIAPIYITLISLIFLERKSKVGRWVFPGALGLFLFIHTIKLSGWTPALWDSFARWFVSLPLT